MKNNRQPAKIFLLFLIFASPLLSYAQISSPRSIYTLPAGTKIRVKMDNEINSKVSSVNDTFTVEVESPVAIRDIEVLPVGMIIEGKILAVRPAGAGKKNGSLDVRFLTLKLPTAKLGLDASLVEAPRAPKASSAFDAITIAGGTAAGALLGAFTSKTSGMLIGGGLGAGVGTTAVFLKRGRDVRIAANEVFEIVLNKDVTLPAEDF